MMETDNEIIASFIDIMIADKVVRMSECRNHVMNQDLQLEANLLHGEINELKRQRNMITGEAPEFESVTLTHEDISEIAHMFNLTNNKVSQGELEWFICSWVKDHKAVDFFEEERKQQENEDKFN